MTAKPDNPPFRLAVLISGGGTTLQNLIDRSADGRLPGVEIAVVISSRSAVAGVDRARRAGLPLEVVRTGDYPDVEGFSRAIAETLDRYGVDLAVQAGWLCYWRLPDRWLGKVINIHPAVLPKYGGRGYYGHHVHEAVIAAREAQSGATVHWVDNQYDHGAIIRQATCPVLADDTPDSLAARVQACERELLPAVILEIRAQKQTARHPSISGRDGITDPKR